MTIERAGGVDKYATGFERTPRIAQDRALTFHALTNVAYRPVGNSLFILAEHTFTRTGCIHQHAIERVGHSLAEQCRSIVRDYGISVAPLLDVLRQDEHPLSYHLVSHQQTLSAQVLTNQRSLATRRSAEVEHQRILAHILLQRALDEHRRCLLHIIATCVEQGVERELRTFGQIVTFIMPRHLVDIRIERQLVNLVVQPDGRNRLLFQGTKQLRSLRTQLLLHHIHELYR